MLGFAGKAWRQVWRTLVAGLLVWVPLLISVWVAWFFLNKFAFGLERLMRTAFIYLREWGASHEQLYFLSEIQYPFGLGLLLTAALFLVTGILTRHIVGRKLIELGERVVRLIPLVNRVYSAAQQIRDVFVGRQGAVFQKVCLVEYPRAGMVAVAFVTSTEQGLVQEETGKQLIAVFVPTTPNPTSGYLIYLPPEDVQIIDVGIEEAMKLVISGGAYIPPYQAKTEHPADATLQESQGRESGKKSA